MSNEKKFYTKQEIESHLTSQNFKCRIYSTIKEMSIGENYSGYGDSIFEFTDHFYKPQNATCYLIEGNIYPDDRFGTNEMFIDYNENDVPTGIFINTSFCKVLDEVYEMVGISMRYLSGQKDNQNDKKNDVIEPEQIYKFLIGDNIDEKDKKNIKTNIFEYIFYEFEMYIKCFFALSENNSTLDIFQKNLVIEGYRFHLRNMIDFLSDKKETEDDIIYKDIISGSCGLFLPNMQKVKKAINKVTSHLTKSRIKLAKTIEEDLHPHNVHFSIVDFIIRFLLELPNGILEKSINGKNLKESFDDPKIQEIFIRLKNILF